MKKITPVLFTLFFAAAGLVSFSVITHEYDCCPLKSNGGPFYNTNAPGEKTCSGAEGTNECHGPAGNNTGPATVSIFSSGGNQYVPGQTYTITPVITHPTLTRFGFQLTALQASNDTNVGDIQITDTTTTRSGYPAYGNFQTREYAMHKLAGSYFTSTTGQWSFNWDAPVTNVGNIILYACFLAANNNNVNDPGDETYYTTLTLTPSGAGTDENEIFSSVSVFPNPVTANFFILKIKMKTTRPLSAEIITLEGKGIQKYFEKKIFFNESEEKITLQNQLPTGVYLLKISSEEKTMMRKIVSVNFIN